MNDDQAAAGSAATPAPPRPSEVRTIARVEELKALSDPTRLAILETLMAAGPELPVMSVKQLAEVLGEPQTKLYRHMRQLESVGLIRVAASRMVSGILEQRYQAAQRDLHLASRSMQEHTDETEAIARAVLDRFRDGFFTAYRASHPPGSSGQEDGDRRASMMHAAARLPAARAAEVRARLAEVLAYFSEPDSDDPDAEDMVLLIGYYPPAAGEPD
jgi:DNA-binding transcriptional ArsR family regulator